MGGGGGGIAPHGNQFFRLEDTDGFTFVCTDAVDVANYSVITMAAWLRPVSTR
jgi:hypothetical protein|eukprot:COSAG01_NODE_926_length_12694_cov_4.945137_4_plen_53_part_00